MTDEAQKPITVSKAIEVLQMFADEGYADSNLFVLAGPNDVRAVNEGDIDEWFSGDAVWIKVRDHPSVVFHDPKNLEAIFDMVTKHYNKKEN